MAKSNRIEGFQDIDKVLAALGKSVGPKVVNSVLRKGAAPFVKQAKQNASNADVTGNLSNSIGVINGRGEELGSVAVGPRRGRGKNMKGHHAHLVEYGTAPHSIVPKGKKALSFGEYFATKAKHPGSAAYPFMRPAWDAKNGEVEKAIAAGLQEVLASNFKGVFK